MRKRSFWAIAAAAVLCGVIMLLCATVCGRDSYYPPNREYTVEQVTQLFYDNKAQFAEVAGVLLRNDEAYAHRQPEGVSRLFLCSSADRYKRYFSDGDYERLDGFFEEYRPYSIERGSDFVNFTFLCTIDGEVEGIAVMYFEGRAHFAHYSQHGLKELDTDWYLWI